MQYPQEVVKELIRRAEKEQALRQAWGDKDDKQTEEEVRATDEDNTEFLKKTVKNYGWPKISEVGQEAARSAWLLVQHTPDRSFLKYCLGLMEEAPDEIESQYLARTIDRVLVLEGKPQRYGTRFTKASDGRWVPLPIEDEDNIDQRRAEMKLPRLEEKSKEYNEE